MRLRRALPSVSGIAKSSALVGTGTLIGQGAVIAAAPLLARIYDPAAFGLLATYAAIIALLVAIASLRYDFAIPISGSHSAALNLLALSAIITIVGSALIMVLVLLFGSDLASLLGVPRLASMMWLVPIGLLVGAMNQSLSSYAVFTRRFGGIARMRTVQGIGQAGSQLVLGLNQAGPFGLIAGDIAGKSIGTAELYRSLRSSMTRSRLSPSRIRASARRFWGFARVMTVASLLGALALQIPFLLIPLLFDLGSAGQYFMAYRLLVLPMSLVTAAVSQVFFGEAARMAAANSNLHQLARGAAISLFVFAIPTYGVVLVAGPELFTAVLGNEWAEAGRYSRIMAPWLLLAAVAGPLSSLLLVGRRERESLLFTALDVLLKSAALVAGASFGSLALGVLFLTLVMVPMNISALWRILRVATVHLRELGWPVLRNLLVAAPSILVLWLLLVALDGAGGIVLIVAASGAAWLVALGLGVAISPETRKLISATDG